MAERFALVKYCSARRPTVRQIFDNFDADRARQDVVILTDAALALRVDVRTFLHSGFLAYEWRETTAEFIQSVYHYAFYFMIEPWAKLRPLLSNYTHNEFTNSVVEDARKAIAELHVCIRYLDSAVKAAGWMINAGAPQEGTPVPTACPYELLHRLFFEFEFRDKRTLLEKASDRDTLLSFQRRKPFGIPDEIYEETSEISRECFVKASNGRPSMVFSAIYRRPDTARLVFGANNPQSRIRSPLPHDVQEITKIQLGPYLRYTTSARNTMEQIEDERLQQLGISPKSVEQRFPVRLYTISEMRSRSEHLGPRSLSHVGLAFKLPHWKPHGPCYLCAGTMSWAPAFPYKEDQDWAKKIKGFSWAARADPTGCAEHAARFQCMAFNLSFQKPLQN
ncbi:hypothetical protein BKA81DRAFT_403202 [Phyllosticta paracitricarpa]|uniref:Uncharacterized protein n=1 Tax=Phyllosticta paracitricarpa TaxID=2016321 RepID=A0ABR1NB15_9PEZI